MKTAYFILLLLLPISFSGNNGRLVNPIPQKHIKYVPTVNYVTDDIVTGTYYHAVAGQTDSSPLRTSDGSYINPEEVRNLKWCALSRDLLCVPKFAHKDNTGKLWKGKYCYGDTILVTTVDSTKGKYVEKILGIWIVHDVMNKRFRGMIDFLVPVDYLQGGKWKNLQIRKIETGRKPVIYSYL